MQRTEEQTLGSREIVQRIREQVKAEFPKCKFSITQEHYSMGWSIHISLMKANFKVIKDFAEISPLALFRLTERQNKIEDIQRRQQGGYHQLNHFMSEYDPDAWNNGVFITEEAHKVLRRVVEITRRYNWDNSDPQTDYFDVNFYLHLNIGKWDKPFDFEVN